MKNWSRRDNDYVQRLLRNCDARAAGAPGGGPGARTRHPFGRRFPGEFLRRIRLPAAVSASAGVVQSTYGIRARGSSARCNAILKVERMLLADPQIPRP